MYCTCFQYNPVTSTKLFINFKKYRKARDGKTEIQKQIKIAQSEIEILEREIFDLEETEIREYLSENLPDYMIPAHIIQIESIPQTANGKIDVKALPNPIV